MNAVYGMIFIDRVLFLRSKELEEQRACSEVQFVFGCSTGKQLR